MTVPVLTFFNNKSGVGKTSLGYHLTWMLSGLGYRVLACVRMAPSAAMPPPPRTRAGTSRPWPKK